jgi:two-component system response regulator YesN
MKLRSPSYLVKLMLFSVLIGTVPVVVLGTFAYLNSSQTVQEKVNESNKQLLQQTQMRVEQILKTIDASATQLLQSPVVTSAFDNEISSKDFELVRELFKGISLIQTYELGTKDVFLYSLSQKWIVNGSGVNEYSVPGARSQMEAFSRLAGGSIWTSGLNKDIAYNSADSQGSIHSIYFVKKFPFNAINPKGIISVELLPDTIKELVTLHNGKTGSTFLLDQNFNIIGHHDRAMLGNNLSGEAYLKPIVETDDANGQYRTSKEGKEVTVTYRKSLYNGWKYVSIASIEEINEHNKIIGWLTLLVSVGILLVTLILAWLGSKKMYSPIQSIYTALTSEPFAASTENKRGELQFIGERVDYLIQNQSLLMNELKGQQVQLKEFFMQKLFNGTIKSDEFKAKLSLYGFKRHWPVMSVLAVQIDTLKDTRFEETDRDLLMFAINNIVGELIPAEQRLVPIVTADCQVTIIGSQEGDADFKEQIFSLSDTIQKAIVQYLKIKVSMGISRPFTTMSETPQAFHEAVTALKYRVGLGQESILFIEDVQPQRSNLFLFPQEREQSLFDAMRTGNLEQSERSLKEFMGELFQHRIQHQDYQLSLLRLLVDIIRFGQEFSIPTGLINQDEATLIQTLFNLRSIEEIEQWFWTTFVAPFILELGSRRESQFKHISEAIIDIIHREFDSELTLEGCSSRINYHPHYVSRVFRQETGINFGEYLTQYRMETAKKWLKATDMKISEVAERLRYNNSANFIRSFRKTVGMTPGQYREEG